MLTGPGMRCYVLVAGGLCEPEYLGSTATFTLAAFGGHDGRTLRAGDALTAGVDPGPHEARPDRDARAAIEEQPSIGHRWEVAVTEGPHGAPEFFTRADIDTIIGTDYTVHFNSDRTGVRLEGPKPQWARTDGGEAGLHPSNIHDNAYCVGALDFTGDTPILLGPDGPSLGGFVCPVTVVGGDRWKLGQMAPGDTVRFVPVRADRAPSLRTIDVDRRASLPVGAVERRRRRRRCAQPVHRRRRHRGHAAPRAATAASSSNTARWHWISRCGPACTRSYETLRGMAVPGLAELTPGVRSLQVQFDPGVLSMREVTDLIGRLDAELPATDDLVVSSRSVRLPLSWDDPSTHEAIQRYMHGVRSDAPWCPDNIEFIRRINGLDDVSQVYDTVFGAQYLVLGLGDVYLGAPVATPLDPRHRLVTTKYNPARTWTPENAVGIGGAYMCIYGMEGPGGYQFVGRTTQVWNHCHPHDAESFEPGTPWLLRYFDRISFYPVSAEELAGPARRHGGGPRQGRHHRRRVLHARVFDLPHRARGVDRGLPRAAGARRSRPNGRRGIAPVSSPDRSRARRRAQPTVHLDMAPCSPIWTGIHSTPKVKMAAKTSRHKEVERKFDVVEATVSPSFDGLSAVARVERLPTQPLDAVYFDTPAHDLARNRITLRRRTGGPDAGWHLKLPAGADARTEVRTPLDRFRRGARRVARRRPGDRAGPAAGARWRASRPSATSRCSTAPTARRWPSSATTRSPRRRVPTTSSTGGNGNSNWPRTAMTSTC